MTRGELVASAQRCWDAWVTGSKGAAECLADWHLDLIATTPEQPPARKVVQSHMEDDLVLVVCNDGAMFTLCDGGTRWRELPPIPQPAPPVDAAAVAGEG